MHTQKEEGKQQAKQRSMQSMKERKTSEETL